MDEVRKQIVASPNQGTKDMILAGLRLLAIVLTTAPAAALLVRKGDLIGLYDYFHTQPGVALLSALSGLAAICFALYKSYKRGREVAGVASDPRVPEEVATTPAAVKEAGNA